MDSEIFDFCSLPYVCQRRIVEFLDDKTLLNFALINSETKKLAKFLHVVEEAKVLFENNDSKTFSITFKLKCFCEENERCNLDHQNYQPPKNAKVNVMDEITITVHHRLPESQVILSMEMLDNLPLNFNSVKRLRFDPCKMNLDDLKIFLNDKPELKEIFYGYRLKSNKCTVEEFIDFIKSLAKFDSFSFELYHNLAYELFNFNDLREPGLTLLQENIVDNFLADWDYVTFDKRRRFS